MKVIRPKLPRIRLDSHSYTQLRLRILERDNWRCQNCGSMQRLQIHHKELRSHSGGDTEGNLITLCDRCHEVIHS
jgi:5-methylcytosine-specific restriction endonuclease McrA